MPPLLPWFSRTFVWEATALSTEQLTVGLGDGRVFHWELPNGSAEVNTLGAPMLVGDVPISASVGHLVSLGAKRYAVVTSGTNIPYGATDPNLRPPSLHPNENTVWVYDGSTLVWSWTGPHRLQGITIDPTNRWLIVGSGPRRDERTDLYGALVFDLNKSGSGQQHLATTCATANPVFWRMTSHADGRIAVTEHPIRHGEDVIGQYRVTVFR